ncbi:MAG: glutathione S-transferase family protein, partial [Peristeroidobacter soli]
LCGDFSIADLGLAPHFSNLAWARAEPDWARWPKTGAWLKRAHAESALGELANIGAQLLRTAPPQHREKLIELSIDVCAETVGRAKPRRGPMQV